MKFKLFLESSLGDFVSYIMTNSRYERSTRLIMADYLEENGYEEFAELFRLANRIHQIDKTDWQNYNIIRDRINNLYKKLRDEYNVIGDSVLTPQHTSYILRSKGVWRRARLGSDNSISEKPVDVTTLSDNEIKGLLVVLARKVILFKKPSKEADTKTRHLIYDLDDAMRLGKFTVFNKKVKLFLDDLIHSLTNSSTIEQTIKDILITHLQRLSQGQPPNVVKYLRSIIDLVSKKDTIDPAKRFDVDLNHFPS